MARRQRSGCGIWILFWIIIILVILIIYLQDTDKNKQKEKFSNKVDKIKNFIFKTPEKNRIAVKNKKMTVELFFVKHIEKNDKLALIKVNRTIPLTDSPLTDTINLLLEGPTPFEEKGKITSVFWGNTKLLNAKIHKKIAYLNFNSEIETGVGISMLQARLYQVIYTATQFPEVEGVKILINGKEKDTYSTEGLSIRYPLKRLMKSPVF